MIFGIYQSYWGRVGGVAELLIRDHHIELVLHCPDFDPCPDQKFHSDKSSSRWRSVNQGAWHRVQGGESGSSKVCFCSPVGGGALPQQEGGERVGRREAQAQWR
jgi:hypothetical protein